MDLQPKQIETKTKIESAAKLFGIDPTWASAVAMAESSLGLNLLSPTGCRGVFQMSTIAMRDLLIAMTKKGFELIGIVCGVAFLWLLLKRHGTQEQATKHFCDPNDRGYYWDRVRYFMKELGEGQQ